MAIHQKSPLLSICIPTYNRAQLLKTMLRSVLPQVKAFSLEVELIVSDNCSNDETREIVEEARGLGPLRYYRNAKNEGAAANFVRLTYELANGEFGWILPDDDLVRPYGVARVLSILKANPQVDYVFVNVSPKLSKERYLIGRPASAADFPELLPVKCKNTTDRLVNRWEDLIDPDIDDVFFGSVMCSVFRLSRWRSYKLKLNKTDAVFPNLEQTYPHAVVLAHTMLGRKAYYIGYPCVITFWGGQSWLGCVPMILTVRLQELLDLYRKLGVDRRRVEKCRASLLSASGNALREMLVNPGMPGRQYFSFAKFVWRNRYHMMQLCFMLAAIVMTRIPKRLHQIILLPYYIAKRIRAWQRQIR